MSEVPGNKYGTTPYSPNTMPSLGEEPRSSRLTKSLIWPLLVLNVLTTVLGTIYLVTVDKQEYYAQSLPPEQFEQMTPEMLEAAHPWTIGSVVGLGALIVILFLIVGLGLRANKTWARFIGLVCAFLFLLSEGISLVFTVNYGDLHTIELISAILSWVTVLLTIWWIVQALNKNTAQWFAMHRRLQM